MVDSDHISLEIAKIEMLERTTADLHQLQPFRATAAVCLLAYSLAGRVQTAENRPFLSEDHAHICRYYICPMHTLWFLSVYLMMRVFPSWNESTKGAGG